MPRRYPLIDPPKGFMRAGVVCPVPDTSIPASSRVLVWSPPTGWITLMFGVTAFNEALISASVHRERCMLRPTIADRFLIERPTQQVYFGDFCYE